MKTNETTRQTNEVIKMLVPFVFASSMTACTSGFSVQADLTPKAASSSSSGASSTGSPATPSTPAGPQTTVPISGSGILQLPPVITMPSVPIVSVPPAPVATTPTVPVVSTPAAPVGPAAPNPGAVQICSGVYADSTGATSASGSIQSCVNTLQAGQTLSFPRGIYLIDQMITLKSSHITLTTTGMLGSTQLCGAANALCAVFKAAPTLSTLAILEGPVGITGLTLDHVNFDGNRATRLQLAPQLCPASLGRDVILQDVTNTSVKYSGFYNALCGTAFGAGGNGVSGFNVQYSVFADNGNHDQYWSDGLTIGVVQNSNVSNNWFYNNSDVSLIFGGAANTIVSNNVFQQTYQGVFAAFMATNWTVLAPAGQQGWGDFRGLQFTQNNMNLGAYADIGIQIGVLPWGGQDSVGALRNIGGTYSGNTVVTSRQGINIAGAGSPDYPVTVTGNNLNRVGVALPASQRSIPTSLFNVQNQGSDSFANIDYANPTNTNWNGAY